MGNALTDEQRTALLGIIMTNSKASVRDIEKLCNAYGFDISHKTINEYQRKAREMVYAINRNAEPVDIQSPVIQTALIEAGKRIEELHEIYYRLKGELEAGGLWSERTRQNVNGGESTEMVLNHQLIKEMRGCLEDIAKEVGGRTSRAIIEHRNTDAGTVDIHTMILNVQQAQETKQNLPLSQPPRALLPENEPAPDPDIIDILPAEQEYLTQKEQTNELS